MESNRNLSSIISRIRDEGPPGGGADVPVAPTDPEPSHTGPATSEAVAIGAIAGRRSSRRLLIGLAVSLAVIIGLVSFAGSYTGYRDDGRFADVTDTLRGWLALSTGPAEDAGSGGGDTLADVVVDEQLVRELRARQLEITARLDELTDTLTALSETVSKNWADNDAVVAGLRQEQQAGVDALEARLSALQRQLAGTVGKTAVADQSAPAKPAVQAKQAKAPIPAKPATHTEQDAPARPAAREQADPAVAGEEWVVNVASSSREQAMVELAARLKDRGIPVERQALTIEGDLMYRLRVPGFATSDEARGYARRLDKDFGLKGGWVSRK